MSLVLRLVASNAATMQQVRENLDVLQILPARQEEFLLVFFGWLQETDPGLSRFRGASAASHERLAKFVRVAWVRKKHAGRRFWWGTNRSAWLRVVGGQVKEEDEDEWSFPDDEPYLAWALGHLLGVVQSYLRFLPVRAYSTSTICPS